MREHGLWRIEDSGPSLVYRLLEGASLLFLLSLCNLPIGLTLAGVMVFRRLMTGDLI